MLFSSTIFIFFFLPLILFLYATIPGRNGKNAVLLIASLFFYAWGESAYILLMIISILMNFVFGLIVDKNRSGVLSKIITPVAIFANLSILGYYKYSVFILETIGLTIEPVHLPIGISFFTFQAISYIVDLKRKEIPVQRNPFNLALYISLFPQLIAGPIVRYHDVFKSIHARSVTFESFSYGIKRFITGLGKKVLIANVLGKTADYFFSVSPETLSASYAWLGAIAYALQIYYDFSGYSDMAIGLGAMFGFRFLENFNYPYISGSIREFWRRWHISLSTWFRDYLYIPIGGSRMGEMRTAINLLLVFLLCGLWHGASWTFVVWGLFHGLFLFIERTKPWKTAFAWLPKLFHHAYTILVVLAGWIFFRSDSIENALKYFKAMADFATPSFFNSSIFICLNNEFYTVLIIAILGATPLFPRIKASIAANLHNLIFEFVVVAFFIFVFLYSASSITGGEHNPFLYFRF